MIILLLAIHHFMINFHMMIPPNIITGYRKGRGTKEFKQFIHLSTKIEVTSTVAITEKNEKQSDHIARYARDSRAILR